MSRLTSVCVGVMLIVTIGLVVYSQKVSSFNESIQTTASTTPSEVTGISATEVAKYNTATSCWTSINGLVYDLSSWIPEHPGGEQAIIQLCGIDGSAYYNGQHGGSKKTTAILSGFKIGVSAN